MDAVRHFQISEDDLAELERVLPQLGESLTPVLTGRDRIHLRRCQTILSNVRWGYGPPTEVAKVSSDGGDDHCS